MANSIFLGANQQFPNGSAAQPGIVFTPSGLGFYISGSAIVSTANLFADTTRGLGIQSRFSMFSPSDGVISLFNSAGTDFIRMNFGGSTNSFPAFKRNGAQIDVRLADDSAFTTLNASVLSATSRMFVGTCTLDGNSPSIASGFGTSPSIVSGGKSLAFRVNVGTGGVASSGVINMGATANNGWCAYVENLTAVAANRADRRTVVTALSTTQITVQSQIVSTGAAVAWNASDILQIIAISF